MLFTDTNGNSGRIVKITLSPTDSTRTTIPLSSLIYPLALDFDPQEWRVYWTDLNLKRISRAFLNGSSQEVIISSGLKEPEGLVVDYVGRNVYWTDRKRDKIEVSKLDGSYRKKLLDVTHPRDIVLDTMKG